MQHSSLTNIVAPFLSSKVDQGALKRQPGTNCLPYLLFIVVNLISGFGKSHPLQIPLVIFTILFLTTTYYNGSDWRQYELIYEDNNLFRYYQHWGGTLEYLFVTFDAVGLSFHAASIVLKILTIAIVFWFFHRNSSRPYFAFALFSVSAGVGLFIDNPLRQMLAVPVFLFALHAYLRTRFAVAASLLALGTFVHMSTIFVLALLLLPTLAKKVNSKRLRKVVVYSTLPVVAIAATTIPFWAESVRTLPYIGFYVRHYISDQTFSVTGSSIAFTVLLIVVYVIGPNTKNDTKSTTEFHLSICFLVVGILGSIYIEALRLNYFLVFGLVLFFSNTPGSQSVRLRLLSFTVFSTLLVNLVFQDYRYLPYTSYPASVITGNLHTYEYRYNFHLNAK